MQVRDEGHEQGSPSRVAELTGPGPVKRSPLPDGGDIVFLCVFYLLMVVVPDLVLSDGSTGWHLVTGQYIIENLRIPHRDLISYTFPNKAWVPYEWLFDVVAALLVKLGGLKLLALAAAAAIAGLFLALYEDMRRTGCHWLIALALTVIGALASSPHWLARPHLFTLFGVYMVSRTLETFHRDRLSASRTIFTLGLTMLVWSNAHPGFLFGFAIVLIYLASETVTAVVLSGGDESRRATKRAGTLLAAAVVMTGAALSNLNGLALYPYLANYLRQTSVLSLMAEVKPPTFQGQLYSTSLELLFASIVVGLATSRRRPRLGQLLVMLAFAHLALAHVYTVELFVIVSLPVIAGLFAESDLPALTGSGRLGHAVLLTPLVRGWQVAAERFNAVESRCTMHLVPITVVAVLAVSCIAAGPIPGVRPLVASQFSPKTKPMATLEFIERARLPWNRGFNLDNWGGYIRYRTGQRVFIDDRLDFYGQEFYLEYVQMINAQAEWHRLLDEYHIQWVLTPKDTLLAARLAQEPDWQLKAQDQAAYLFVRRTTP